MVEDPGMGSSWHCGDGQFVRHSKPGSGTTGEAVEMGVWLSLGNKPAASLAPEGTKGLIRETKALMSCQNEGGGWRVVENFPLVLFRTPSSQNALGSEASEV